MRTRPGKAPANIPLRGKIKLAIKWALTGMLGLERYLFWFSHFKIATVSFDRRDRGRFYMLDNIDPDATVLDIGANIGIMTVLFARRVPRGTVHAFEPDPVNFRVLERVVSSCRLKNVILHRVALSSASGEVEMVTPVWSSVRMHGLTQVVTSAELAAAGDTFKVPMQPLDGVELLPGGKIQAIKIDVEDHEPQVIEGARALIAAQHPIICAEFLPRIQPECFRLMDRIGYDVYACAEDGELQSALPGSGDGHNFICKPRAGARLSPAVP